MRSDPFTHDVAGHFLNRIFASDEVFAGSAGYSIQRLSIFAAHEDVGLEVYAGDS